MGNACASQESREAIGNTNLDEASLDIEKTEAMQKKMEQDRIEREAEEKRMEEARQAKAEEDRIKAAEEENLRRQEEEEQARLQQQAQAEAEEKARIEQEEADKAEALRLEQIKLEEEAAAEEAQKKKEEEEKKREEDKRTLLDWLKKNGFKSEDVNTKKKGGMMTKSVTPLFKAVTAGSHDVVRILIDFGADVKEEIKGGKTLIDKARGHNNKQGSHNKVIEILEAKFKEISEEQNTATTDESKAVESAELLAEQPPQGPEVKVEPAEEQAVPQEAA